MKNIKVLGGGCPKCRTTAERIESTARSLGVEIELEKVEDYAAIAAFGVTATPSVIVDGVVVHSGGVPAEAVIADWMS